MLGKCRHILPELPQDCWTGGDIELGGTVPGGVGDQKGMLVVVIMVLILDMTRP